MYEFNSGRTKAALAAVVSVAAVAFAAPALAAPTGGSSAAEGTGTIEGFVWNDLNHNGIQEAGEPGAANVRIGYQEIVDGQRGPYFGKANTGPDGAYSIPDVPAGDYDVIASTDYWLFTTASAGGDRSKDSDFVDYINNPGPGVQQWAATGTVTIDAGSTVDFDAGVVQRPGGSGTIRGRAWDDRNHNGIQNRGELGVAGVEIGYQHVIGGVQTGNTLGNVLTGADGTYVLEDVTAGHYKVFATTADRDFTTPYAGDRPKKDSDFQPGGVLGSDRLGRSKTVTIKNGKTLVLDAGLVERK